MVKEKNTNQKITYILSPYANEMEDKRLGIFLALSVGRVLLNSNSVSIDDNHIRHITDWLKASIINNEAWLSNLDDQSRPKKLMKFNSIDQIYKEADKAMIVANQKLRNIKISEGDEKLVAELENGYYVIKLLTPAALDGESSQMQHCIGQGGYDDNLKTDEYEYLSLRDPAGKAHVTIEIQDGEMIQIQGKQNERPIKKYRDILKEFFSKNKYKISNALAIRYFDSLVDQNGVLHHLSKLPEGMIVTGNLKLRENVNFELKIPNNFTVKGDLMLIGFKNSPLPSEGLRIEKSFCIEISNIRKLPNRLYVGEDIILENSKIYKIPEDIYVGRNWHLVGSKKLKSLPDNLTIKGYLDLDGCKRIQKLPKNLNIHGDLLIDNSAIGKFPECLKLNGDLTMRHSKIKRIPKNIVSLRSLIAPFSDLEDISSVKNITHNLDISRTKIKEISNITINGDMAATNSMLEKIGDNVEIKGSAFLEKTKITSISNDVRVYGHLTLTDTPIEELPDDLTVNGNLGLLNTSNLKKLPSKLTVKNTFYISHSQITSLPDNLNAGTISISHCENIKSLSKGLKAYSLSIDSLPITEFPEDLDVKVVYMDKKIILPDSINDDVTIHLLYKTGKKEAMMTSMSAYEYRLKMQNEEFHNKM